MITRIIGFDIFKKPIKNSNRLKIELTKEIYDNEQIAITIFNDVYQLMNIMDFNRLQKVHKKYLEYWNSSEVTKPPMFPVISYDVDSIIDAITLYETSSDITCDSDANGYEWDESERIIDSLGNLYELQYLNFGHPMGVMIPKKIIRKVSEKEIGDILKNKDVVFNIKTTYHSLNVVGKLKKNEIRE